jgi:AraC-like DNA-binding protein
MMAEHIGITDTYCSRYIKKRTGLTFTDYLTGVRIGKAEELLRKTKKTVTEIVYETGFGSVQTFNRVFKKKKNLTPSEYRSDKMHKK